MNQIREPLVSICCITYNHERYIGEAIEGFLKQETDFSFEIIIQDDASTDKTADIIKEYEEKYPGIIKPIYNKENQYSKCPSSIILPPLKVSKGKFIAFCEGDDYWTDPLKLQKQITEMEKYPNSNLSFHPAIAIRDDKKGKDKLLCLHSKITKIFSIEESILGGGEFMPTASIMIRKDIVPRITSFFDTAKDAPVGDYYIQILGAQNGGALYINEIMSVYRAFCPGSWSEKTNKDQEYITSVAIATMDTFGKIDAFTDYKYSNLFNIKKRDYISELVLSFRLDLPTRENIFNLYRAEINAKDRFIWRILFKRAVSVRFFKFLRKIQDPLNIFGSRKV